MGLVYFPILPGDEERQDEFNEMFYVDKLSNRIQILAVDTIQVIIQSRVILTCIQTFCASKISRMKDFVTQMKTFFH